MSIIDRLPQMALQTAGLERDYEKAAAASARLLDAERDRVRRMEHLLLQFERDALRSQLDQANEQTLRLAKAESDTCQQLGEAEISNLSHHSTGYNTALSEKQRLLRETTALRTEVERLQAQNSSYQALVAEKRELERQFNSLEVELENERHAHGRTQTKASQQAEELAKVSARVEELRSELAVEARAQQQQDRDSRQQGWESQRAVLEGKIESLKKQLRSTKTKLQEAQEELQHRRSMRMESEDASYSRSRMVPLQRAAPDYPAAMTIATPGAVRVQEKVKRPQVLPGDKSAFSITPFLNRTGAPSDSPNSSVAEADEIHLSADESQISIAKYHASSPNKKRAAAPVTSTKNPGQRPEAGEGKSVLTASRKEAKKPASRLGGPMQTRDLSDELPDPPAENGGVKVKKRKLGAQRDRLFDEEEEEEEEGEELETRKPGRKLALGNSVVPVTGGPRALGFGAPVGFSPLKRDRKR
ncbi:hypothetical protein N7510_008662 [Penicillium lagena]|uniref:uncharacterized protein n=1 Tax=Penicillium lagena TaxID=94218 RepID=UPI00253FDDF1|nr:uncharacterized protein N7510_008662 [Penicillium lagena]KAJ5605881.1 hypothetical protein N7510_008662 [Penicillium lagena]